MPGTRSYVPENFSLTLDGVQCGFLRSVEGGDIAAEVIEEAVGASFFAKKHVGPPFVEDFVVEAGFGIGKPVYDWIAASWAVGGQQKSGSIVLADFNLKAHSERRFANALLTETTFPKLDAASKEPAYLTLRFSAESVENVKGSGKVPSAPKQQQKLFLPSNFRLELGELDCKKVSKVESFTVRQTIVSDQIGDARDYIREPGRVEFPNLRVTLAETTAATWDSWFEDFVVEGKNDDSKEKSGAIVFLSPNLKDEVLRVKLFNVGIFALRRPARQAHDESIRRVVADLYVERMELDLGKAAPELLRREAGVVG